MLVHIDNDILVFDEVTYGTPIYDEYVALRQAVLRTPLGQTFDKHDLLAEHHFHHFAMYNGRHQLLGCLMLVPHEQGVYQMRQVAVDPKNQRQGYGSQLINLTESWLRMHKAHTIWLHARSEVIPFYEKLGYESIDQPFEEISIPHQKMIKTLSG